MSRRQKLAKRERGAVRRAARRERLLRGLAVVEQGGRYCDAAEASGYSDAFEFSKAVYRVLRLRPHAAVTTEWRAAINRSAA